jgi:hypothetical protein
MASARAKIGNIAGKRGISMTNAKRYYYDRLDAEARGEKLPFYKWAKSNLGYSNVEGDTEEPMGAKPKGMLAKAWKNQKPLVIGIAAVVGYFVYKRFSK